jgi:hypothetical protein
MGTSEETGFGDPRGLDRRGAALWASIASSTIPVMFAESDDIATAVTSSPSLGNATLLIGRG